jgi:predicted small metal-binding protein
MASREYKQLTCRDFGADCDFLVRAETEEKAIKIASDHARRVHGKCEISREMKDQMRSLIKNVSV